MATDLFRAVFSVAPVIDWGEFNAANEEAVAKFVHAAHEAMDDASPEDRAVIKHGLRLFKHWLVQCQDHLRPRKKTPPAELLKLLMDGNGLKPSDLLDELGSASTVSHVLNGKREINARQAGLLAKRFAVRVDAFLPEPEPYTCLDPDVTQSSAVKVHTVNRYTDQDVVREEILDVDQLTITTIFKAMHGEHPLRRASTYDGSTQELSS